MTFAETFLLTVGIVAMSCVVAGFVALLVRRDERGRVDQRNTSCRCTVDPTWTDHHPVCDRVPPPPGPPNPLSPDDGGPPVYPEPVADDLDIPTEWRRVISAVGVMRTVTQEEWDAALPPDTDGRPSTCHRYCDCRQHVRTLTAPPPVWERMVWSLTP